MKSVSVFFALLVCASSARAEYTVSGFNINADQSFSFTLTDGPRAELMEGRFAEGDSAALESSWANIFAKHHGKMIVLDVVKPGSVSGYGQMFIFEEMNSLFVPLTLKPILGQAKNFSTESARMIEIAAIANGGDVEAGLRKIVESFRLNPRMTIQSYLVKMAAKRNGAIAVGERHKMSVVKSFDELEGLPSEPGSHPPVKHRRKKQ